MPQYAGSGSRIVTQKGGHCQNTREVLLGWTGIGWPAGKNPIVLIILAGFPAFAETATCRQVSASFWPSKKWQTEMY